VTTKITPKTDARFVCAWAGSHHVAFAIAAVQEVLSPRAITRLFHAPAAVLGVVNLRGEILPVVDLAQLLGDSPSMRSSTGDEARLVVLRVQVPPPTGSDGPPVLPRSTQVAVHVGRLDALRDAGDEEIAPLPAGIPESAARFARGILASPPPAAMLIDPERLVACEELAQLRMS
jgi:purine-binding chemotaxis protein CheW